jgi:hypothetical protein
MKNLIKVPLREFLFEKSVVQSIKYRSKSFFCRLFRRKCTSITVELKYVQNEHVCFQSTVRRSEYSDAFLTIELQIEGNKQISGVSYS